MHVITVVCLVVAIVTVEIYYCHVKRLAVNRRRPKANISLRRPFMSPGPVGANPKRFLTEKKLCELLEQTGDLDWPVELHLEDETSPITPIGRRGNKSIFDGIEESQATEG